MSTKLHSVLDSVLNFLVPFLITLIFSSWTVRKLIGIKKSNNLLKGVKKEKNRKNRFENENSSFQKIKIPKSITLEAIEPDFMIVRYMGKRKSLPNVKQAEFKYKSPFVRKKAIIGKNKLGINSNKIKRQTLSKLKITFMLMVLPISFLLTTFPVFSIIFYNLFINYSFKLKIDLENAFDIAKLLMFLNNSLNMIFLIVFSKSFRKDLKSIFARRKPFRKSFVKYQVSYV